jgi:excisionase family DNA binding protein
MTGRWTYRTSAAGVIILAAAAFTLSYDALHQLALDSRVRPALAWLWPVVIVGTIVVALLTVLAAKRAATRAGYPWMLAGLFSAASVAFNIAHAPDRPIAQLVFAMAPVALVLTTPAHAASHLAPRDDGLTEPMPAPEAGPEPAQPHTLADQPAQPPAPADQRVPAGARARVRAAYEAHVQAGQTPSGAGLARAAGVSACSLNSPPNRADRAIATVTASRAAASPTTLMRRGRREVVMDRLLTAQEAADRLGTSTRFVRRLIFERRIPFIRIGHHVRIAASDVDASSPRAESKLA